MNVREIIAELDSHHQMAASWRAILKYLQRTTDDPLQAIAVENGVRSTMVSGGSIEKIRNLVRAEIEKHQKMISEFEDVIGKDETLPAPEGTKKLEPNKKDKKLQAVKEKTEQPEQVQLDKPAEEVADAG